MADEKKASPKEEAKPAEAAKPPEMQQVTEMFQFSASEMNKVKHGINVLNQARANMDQSHAELVLLKSRADEFEQSWLATKKGYDAMLAELVASYGFENLLSWGFDPNTSFITVQRMVPVEVPKPEEKPAETKADAPKTPEVPHNGKKAAAA